MMGNMADDANQKVVSDKNQVGMGLNLPFSPTGGGKEHIETSVNTSGGELGAENVVEVAGADAKVEVEKKPELAGYIEEVEKAVELPTTVMDDYTGQVLLNPAKGEAKIVELPLTEDQVVQGLHMQVYDSLRWMAEWCVRQIKLLHGRVKYKG